MVSEEDPDSVTVGRQADCYWLIRWTAPRSSLTGTTSLPVTWRWSRPPTNARIRIGPGAGPALLWGTGVSLKRINRLGDITILKPRQRSDKTRVASKSHLNAETQSIDAIEGPTEPVQAGSSLKFLKIAEGLADIYPLGPTCEWDTAAAHAVVLGVGGSVKNPTGLSSSTGKMTSLTRTLSCGTLRVPDR